MGYKFLVLTDVEWKEINHQFGYKSVFENVSFLDAIAEVYKLSIVYNAVMYKDDCILCMAFFVDKGKIIIPNHYLYQSLNLNSDFKSSWILTEGFDFLIKNLKQKFNSIELRLPISLFDIRSFAWNNFSIKPRFTYTKELNLLNYHINIDRIIKNNYTKYSFKESSNWPKNWEFHLNDLIKFNVKKSDAISYIAYLKELKIRGLVETFDAYDKDVFISSIIAIVDLKNKKAYFPLIGTTEGHNNTGLSALLYHYTFLELKKIGIENVDFLGANYKSIARFKSKFLPELHPYYEVSYSRNLEFFLNIINKVKIISRKLF